MKRRALLATIGTATVGLQAGCLANDGPGTDDGTPDGGDSAGAGGDDNGGDGDSTDGDGDGDAGESTDGESETRAEESTGDDGEDDGDPTEGGPSEPDVEPEVLDTEIETTGTDCASRDRGEVSVEFDADGVTVEGVAVTPNPCYEAVLESAEAVGGELAVEVGFERTSEMCMDCVGEIAYEVRVDLEGVDGVDTVVVDHGDHGGTHGVSRASDQPQPPEETPTDSTPSEPDDTKQYPTNEADPNLPIIVENRHDQDHEIQITITRESGDVVYDEAVQIDAESTDRVYNLEEADPDGIEEFAIRTAVDGQTDSTQVKTDSCHGDVLVRVTAEGELDIGYSIC